MHVIFAFLIEEPLPWLMSSFSSYFLSPCPAEEGSDGAAEWVPGSSVPVLQRFIIFTEVFLSEFFLPSYNKIFLSVWALKDQIFLFGLTFLRLQVFKMLGKQKITYTITREEQWLPTAVLADFFPSLTQSTCFNSALPQISHAPFLSGRKGDNS